MALLVCMIPAMGMALGCRNPALGPSVHKVRGKTRRDGGAEGLFGSCSCPQSRAEEIRVPHCRVTTQPGLHGQGKYCLDGTQHLLGWAQTGEK